MRRAGVALCFVLAAGAARAEGPWRSLAGAATDVAVGADGTLWAIGTDPVPGGKTILRWTGQAWETIPGGATRIAVDPKGAAWVINDTHIIHRWTGTGWEALPGGADDIGIGADGTVWVIGGGGTPYRWTGSDWTAIDGGGKEIAVDPKGQPWVVNEGGEIWQRDGAQWKLLPGKAKDLAIAADGTVYALGARAGLVQRLQGTTWTPVTGATGTRIGAGPKGTVVVAGNTGALAATGTLAAAAPLPPTSATIAIAPPPQQQPQSISVAVPAPVIVAPVPGVIAVEAPSSGPAWKALPGGATDVGVGASGVLWAIGTDAVQGGKTIHRWNGQSWERMPGGAVRLAVDPQGMAWVVTEAHLIFRWTGSSWEQMPGGADDVGVGADGTVWVLGANAVWRWTGSTWTPIDGANVAIAVGPDGRPWVVNEAGEIRRRNAEGSGWELLPGTAQDITVAADGTVYVIGKGAGSVSRYDGTRWIVDPGAGGGARIAAGPPGVIVVASPAGSLLATGTPAVPAGVQAPAPSGMVMTGINLGNAVTSGAPTGSATQTVGGSSAQGSLGVSGGASASSPAGTQTSQPLVVTGEYPPSVVPGKLVCSDGGDPTWNPCGLVDALTFGPWKAHLLECSEGFYDPIFGGSCWKCDGNPTGKVDGPEACAKERWYAADWVASATTAFGCPARSFWDSYNGGNCYHCGDGERTQYAINTPHACKIVEHKPAEFVKGVGCANLTEWTPGRPRVWVQSLAACMGCPVLDQTNSEVLVSEQWMAGVQCKVRFRWTPAQVKGKRIGGTSYADALPGSGALVKEMLADHEQVTGYLKFRALETGTPPAEIPALVERQWADLVANPGQSPTVKAMLFARVLGALADPREVRTPEEQTVIDGFAAHVQTLRQTAAQDAYQMYKAWKKSVDDLRQSRRSNLGDLFSYGTVPLDFDTARQAVALGSAVGLGGFGITASYGGYLSNIGSTTIRTLEKRVVDASRVGDAYRLDRTLLGGVKQSTTKAGTDVVRQVRTVQQVATQAQKAGKVVTVTKNLNGLSQSARAVTNMIRAGSIADDVANGGKAIVTSARAAIAGVTAAGAGVTVITAVAGILLEIAIDDFVAITTAEQTLKDKVTAASQPVHLEDMLDDEGGGTELGLLWSNMLDASGNPEPDLVTAAQAAAAAAKAARYPTGATFGDVLGRGTDVARSEDGTVWAIGEGGTILRRGATDTAWTTLPGGAARVSVGSGDDAWVVNAGGQVYAWRSGTWSMICSADLTSCGGLGPAADVAVSATGAVWVVNRAGKLLRYDGTEWVAVYTPVPAVRVDAAADVLATIVGNDRKVYVLLGDHWVDLRTPTANDVSIDESGTVWAAWTDGAIAYLRPNTSLWQDLRLPGSYTAIATGTYPVVVSSSSEIRVANLGHVAR